MAFSVPDGGGLRWGQAPSHPEVPPTPTPCLRGHLPFRLYISLLLFPFCSQTFPKGLSPQAQPLRFVLFYRLRLRP